MNRFLLSLVFLLFAITPLLTYPTDGTNDDFSSPFGPRALNGYDFHSGVDIGNVNVGDPIYSISNGWIIGFGNENNANEYVMIYDEEYDDTIKYVHIDVNQQYQFNYVSITFGDTIGSIKAHSGGPHLHLSYFCNLSYISDNGDKPVNPFRVLGFWSDHYDEYPVIVDKEGNDVTSGYQGIEVEEDENGKYFKFGVRSIDDELDVTEIQFLMRAEDFTNGQLLDHNDLYDYEGTVSPAELGKINYEEKLHCLENSPDNINMIIEPRVFNRNDDYHTVYIIQYLNNNFPTSGTYWISINLWDTNDYYSFYQTDWIPVCIDCYPPAEASAAPTLNSATMDQEQKAIKLEIMPAYSGYGVEFYKIYRCPVDQTMTDRDVVAITPHSNYPDYYYDDDPELEIGKTYNYAVAGVNAAGEGYNSNTLTCTFGEELPEDINENLTLSGYYYITESTIQSGHTLTVNENSKLILLQGSELFVLEDAICKIEENAIMESRPGTHIVMG
jgi:hypothetical protein